MALIRLRNVHLAFGGPELLDGAELHIEKGERVCLVGRNGAGKSTLMKVVSGDITPDSGQRETLPGLKIARLEQEVPATSDAATVYHVVAAGLGEAGELFAQMQQLESALMSGDAAAMRSQQDIQERIEQLDAWGLLPRIEMTLTQLELDGSVPFQSLSGGWKRRVLLGRALVQQPDLLLLDEPTNHLDLPAIEWLETFLSQSGQTLLFITHDRSFLTRVATRILDLDRGRLTSWPGNYDNYLRRKAEVAAAEEAEWERFDKKLANEEVWIRQGIKARRTRNEGRVRALKAMRAERAERRERQGNVKANIQEASASGKKVIELNHVSVSHDGKYLIRDFSTTVMRGDRIGILGPNGAGKSTLLRVMLGHLQPDSGTCELGTNLQIAYFDQLRETLDEDRTVRENVGQGSDTVTINGEQRHIIGYLQDFLFTPERAHSPIKSLSGGERNRLLLARLFTQPANLLVLDEPTNDLDVETLELLESLIAGYQGTLLLVSHDRAFLDNVVTSLLVFEENGHIGDYVGGYEDWLRQRPATKPNNELTAPAKAGTGESDRDGHKSSPPAKAKRLSYKEQRQLAELPQQIEALESEMATIEEKLADPNTYQQEPEQVAPLTASLEALQARLQIAYEQWDELESRQN